jgi:uncharacterized protein with HEPN domain
MRDPDALLADIVEYSTQMASMRNRLAHEYDAVDMLAVWLTVVRDLPAILKLLDA